MKKIVACSVILSVILASCGTSQETTERPVETKPISLDAYSGNTPADQIIKEMGGLKGLFEFVNSEDAATVEQKAKAYGLNYIDWRSPKNMSALAADGCPGPVFGYAERGTMQTMPDNTIVWIDNVGRPYRAAKTITPITPTTRTWKVDECSAYVGKLEGRVGFQGGHLVGLQLGGWGLRSNLVPQNTNFNTGNWAQIENAAKLCQSLHNNYFDFLGRRGSAYYSTIVLYSNTTTYTPYEFQLTIETYRPTFNTSDSEVIYGAFTNTAYGGADGSTTRQRMVQELRDEGCV